MRYIAFLFSLVIAACCLAQGVPPMMNYQGRLTKADGTPVQDGTYKIRFAIYDQAVGGTERWFQLMDPVVVRNGVFAVLLGGPQNPLSAEAFSGPTWLEIQVGNDPPLAPRQQIVTVAYAFRAERSDNGVPVGGVIPWWGDPAQVPSGWKVCDGTAISDPQSPLNGMVVPDLRDRFVRGAAGNVRPNAPTGGSDTHTLTVAQMPAHSHGVNDPGHAHTAPTAQGGNPGSYEVPDLMRAYDHTDGAPTTRETTGITIQATGGGQPFDTVPRYVGLVYIMRVR